MALCENHCTYLSVNVISSIGRSSSSIEALVISLAASSSELSPVSNVSGCSESFVWGAGLFSPGDPFWKVCALLGGLRASFSAGTGLGEKEDRRVMPGRGGLGLSWLCEAINLCEGLYTIIVSTCPRQEGPAEARCAAMGICRGQSPRGSTKRLDRGDDMMVMVMGSGYLILLTG